MSTVPPTHKKLSDADYHRDRFKPMSLREKLLGMLLVIFILLFAIVLKSL